jgi:CDP-diacylglycerol--glycerol-3-phosphate 3-phosphatidyltransferase
MLTNMARARADAVLNRLARFFLDMGFSPNALTIAGFVGMCLIAVMIAAGYEAVGGVLIIVAGIFDAVDGALARLANRVTKFGAFLDSTLDRWAESLIFLAIVFRSASRHDDVTIYLAVIALFGSLLVSYTRARAEGLGATIKGGWLTRFERMVVLVAGLILTAWFGPIVLTIALAIIGIFANLTALQRLLAARQALR